MQKFLVLYMAPARVLEEWMKLDESVRKNQEVEMKAGWDAWMQTHGSMLTGMTAGAGKTRRVTSAGAEDVKNDVMMFSIIEAESQDAAATAFQNHPHFGIPEGWIDIMPAHVLSGMN